MAETPALPPTEIPAPAVEDLSKTENPRDLSRVEEPPHKLKFGGLWGIGSFELGASGKAVGSALAWLILVVAGGGAAWGVQQLAVSYQLTAPVALPLVLITGTVILGGGAYFVMNLQDQDSDRRD